MHLSHIALVLEGGGMRGMFSAGVFEAFLLKELTFPYITAVSAGACNILSICPTNPCAHVKLSKTMSPINAILACKTG